jgi:eukaryotic-like serine/threonine-protein kinase
VLHALGAPAVLLREPSPETIEPALKPHTGALPADAATRYQLHGEIARGGMGAVLKGRDTGLGRDIALKVLLETHAGKTELVQRFVEEAQIAGQLQHPGITPVYELGQLADKRPYFSMKLVKGKTLAAMLARRQDGDRAQLLKVFEPVCQTLAYAHARNVIHRDLKPANVMVGAFGEVQVMDWGLAKVLKEGGVADEQSRERQRAEAVSVIQTQRSGGTPEVGAPTEAGSVLGTPAYMAPEQARGDVDLVDARADVFGLGAILCEILTGEPPFTGTKAEMLRKASTAQLEDAIGRLDGCGADAELIDLARRCLAAEPWHRPRDASEVAAAVIAYQTSVAQRLHQAELAQAAEAARAAEAQATAVQERKARESAQALVAAERRARRLTRRLAACVLLLLTVGAAGGLWLQQQWAERAAEALRQREAVETALDKARELRQQARWAEARAVLEQTLDRLGEAGPGDLRQRVAQATADLALVDRLEDIRMKRSAIVEGKLDDRGAERDYAAALRDAGLGEVGDDSAAVAARIRESAVNEQLVAAVDDWAVVTHDPERRAWLLEVARRADPDTWRDRFRDPKVWSDRLVLEALAKDLLDDEKQLARQTPQLLAALGSALRWTTGNAVPLLVAAQARHPDDFWLHLHLGNALHYAHNWSAAIGFNRAAVAVRPSAAAAHNNLAMSLLENRQLHEAVAEFRRAIELDPEDALPHNNLGIALYEMRHVDEAIVELRRAIELDPKFALPHNNLGIALYAKHRVDEAIVEFRRAIELDRTFAWPHNNLGNVLRKQKQLDEATQEYRRAIELDPKDAKPHDGLGSVLCDKQQMDEAIAEFRRAIELDPKDAKPHFNLGNVLRDTKRVDEAIVAYRRAMELDSAFAKPHTNLGNVLFAQKHMDEAITAYRRAIELDPEDALPHYNLGNALYQKKHVDEAIQAYRRAIALDPNYAAPHLGLGIALADKKQSEGAIREYRHAVALNPDYAQAHCNLGHALRDQGQFVAAVEELRKGHALGSQQPNWRYPSARWVKDAERLVELDATLSAVLEGKAKPANDGERLALARLCQQPFKKLYAASARFFAEAFANDARLADDMRTQDRYNAACAAALAGGGQGTDADKLKEQERARLRKQAVAWLRADLDYWSKQAESTNATARSAAQQALQHWQSDADLAGIRDRDAVAKLPADERETCRQLWADVADVLKNIEPRK